ncbi:MAG TPA: ABC transporter permease [Acidobacteriaceae bacterium]
MSWWRFLKRKQSDDDLVQEIEAHLAAEIEENLERGMNEDEARRRAYLKFGSQQRVHEELWEQNSLLFLENLWRDLRHTTRTLLRSPGFTLIAIIVMTLGIGANTALFTLVRSVLLKPLPYQDPNRLVMLYEAMPEKNYTYNPVAGGIFHEWQRTSTHVEQMALIQAGRGYNVFSNGGLLPENIPAAVCSWNLFSTLGVQPALGRVFQADDDRPEANGTVILSWSFWKRRFSGDPEIVGKDIFLNEKPYTVIGVMPSWFAYPEPTSQVWTPVYHESPEDQMRALDSHSFHVVARLKPNATLAATLSELNAVQSHIRQQNSSPAIMTAVMGRSMLDDVVRDYKTPLYVLLAATGCVLLIACLNVANLLVARSSARRKEVAIRAALGGSRWRLIREQMPESFVLSFLGGALGLVLADIGLPWLTRTRLQGVGSAGIHIDWLVLLFVVGITLLSGTLAGGISAVSLSSNRVLDGLQESSRSNSGGIQRAKLRKALLAIEVGLTVVLLIAAGLLIQSYRKLQHTDLGCAVDNVLTMHVSLPDAHYKDPARRVAFFEQLLTRIRALPGAQAAGMVAETAPGQGYGGDDLLDVVEHPPLPKGQTLDAMYRAADPGYFAAMQIPLLRGRTFNDHERLDQGNVVVISQLAAQRFFPGEDPIGKHLRMDIPMKMSGIDTKTPFEIVGVVGDTPYRVGEDKRPTMYWPLYAGHFGGAAITLRSGRDVESLSLPVQRIIGQMDPNLAVANVETMRQTIHTSTVDAAFDSYLVLAFAAIAVVLASIGLYGVLSYLVTQRTSEIGIRMALGAQRREVLQLVLLDGLTPAWVGLGLGLVGADRAVQLIRSMLYGTNPVNWTIFAEVALLLSLVASLACAVPAWRASRLDPARALRTE